MDRRKPKPDKSQNNSYKVSVRGEVSADLVNRISALHALCVLHAREGRRPPVAKDLDDYTDAWFVGFDADISVGVWVGYDEKKTLGDGEEGAAVALPIWRDFFAAYIEGRGAPEGFVPPDNIVFTSVDQVTGELAEPWSREVIQEAFIAGTEPGATFVR